VLVSFRYRPGKKKGQGAPCKAATHARTQVATRRLAGQVLPQRSTASGRKAAKRPAKPGRDTSFRLFILIAAGEQRTSRSAGSGKNHSRGEKTWRGRKIARRLRGTQGEQVTACSVRVAQRVQRSGPGERRLDGLFLQGGKPRRPWLFQEHRALAGAEAWPVKRPAALVSVDVLRRDDLAAVRARRSVLASDRDHDYRSVMRLHEIALLESVFSVPGNQAAR
jgi:hypothetical protein